MEIRAVHNARDAAVVHPRAYGAFPGATAAANTTGLQAAADAVFNAGGGTVILERGTYDVAAAGVASLGCVRLKNNVALVGAGMDVTVLKLVAGTAQDLTGVVRTPSGEVTVNVTVADLTIDGNKANNAVGIHIGFYCGVTPGSALSDLDIRLYRVKVKNTNAYGIDPHERTTRFVAEDCIAESCGSAGSDNFTLDWLIDSTLTRCVSIGSARYGFNLVTTSTRVRLVDCIAESNTSSGFQVQNNSTHITLQGCTARANVGDGINVNPANDVTVEGCHAIGNTGYGVRVLNSQRVAIRGCHIEGNLEDGIRIQRVTLATSHVDVTNNRIYNNTKYGVQIMGGQHCQVIGNKLVNNCQASNNTRDEVALLAATDNATDNLVVGNLMVSTAANKARYGVNEQAGGDNNLIVLNKIIGAVTASTAFVGAGTVAASSLVTAGAAEAVNVVAASGVAQTIPAPSVATIHRYTLTGNCTFTMPAAVAGTSFTVVLTQDASGSRTGTFTGVKWAGGTPPALSTAAAKVDYLSFLCADGSTWAGFVGGLDVR